MIFSKIIIYLFCSLLNLGKTIHAFGPQPKIVSQSGHLIIYAADHKNITLVTRGKGGIDVNGIDLAKAAKISNSAMEAMEKYKTNFESFLEKFSRLEQLFDDGFMEKMKSINSGSKNNTEINVSSRSVIRSIRRLNKKVDILQTALRALNDLLNENECKSNPCRNGGTCQDIFNGFICFCPPEWEGSFCDKDVNECARFTGTDLGCQNGATCVNRQGSYECLCSHGWFGLHCTGRSKDCKSGSNSELCGHGTCVTQYNEVGYTCICEQGWTTDGKSPACNTDVDECSMKTHPCSVNPMVQCINLPGSFHCGNCPAGYSGNGYACADIDECAVNNGGCSMNPMVQCVNTMGSRICGSCPPGYLGDGTTCSYQGVCSVNNGGCSSLATCRNNQRIGSTFVECVCPLGYVGNGVGPNGCVRSLQPLDNPCRPNPCRHGFCRNNGTSNYTCVCYSRRYTGRLCDSYRNLCESNPCLNGGTCTSILGFTFRCSCTSSYTGTTCEEEKQSCGGRLQSETGVLVYPSGYSYQNYEHSISCAWIIETNATKVLNITFKRFNIERSANCQYDWLQIHDGKNTLATSLGRFCGNNLPKGGEIISTHNSVYLWFRSDDSVANRGFELSWTSIDPACGNSLTEVTSHGTLHSPGSPGNYPNNRDCYWPLKAPLGKRLLFHFFTLMIGDNLDCEKDYLEFISGTLSTDEVFAKFCNTSHPSPLFSPGPEVLVHFHSDSDKNYPGFQITYSVVEAIPGCGGVYTNRQGEIRSPSYNGRYTNDVLCEYKIQLPDQSRIKLTFVSFALEESEQCKFDYVAIHAGSTSDDPLISRYCGTNLPSPYITESNKILIVFKTDWESDDEGFVLRYETVCGGRFTGSSGTIQSPGYPNNYPNSIECIYEIVQPLSRNIELKFLDLNLERNFYTECYYDFLEVRDGHYENSTLIGKYCDKIPPLIVSSFNYLWIKFVSDANNNGRGFKANYTTTDLACGGILKDKTSTISTPNYPEVYTRETICKWIIVAPPGNVIQIAWMNFQLEASPECTYDYVEIFQNDTETGMGSSLGKFCGHTSPPLMLSNSNMVTIVFSSDQTYSARGFLATYSFLLESNVCGGNYYASYGYLKSPNYPNNYPTSIECSWTIQVKPGHQILLNITDFSLEDFSTCKYDYLEIRNGGSASSPLLEKYCGTNIPKLIPSHANKLYIHFKSDMTKSKRGFRITWEATATGCGGNLNSPAGSITTPNYPEPYTRNTECMWKISVSLGSVIQLIFSDLDLEEDSDCALDYVELFDGPSLNSKSLGKFCMNNPPPIKSTSNNIMIKFKSDISQHGRGFQLQYATMCNNTVEGFRGVIESPNFPNSYPNNLNCNWEIIVAAKNKINISFSHFDLEKIMPIMTNNKTECIYDFVEILYIVPVSEYKEEGTFEKYAKYCGDAIPPLITLNSDHAKIRLVSDNLLHGSGFRLEWQIEGCGDILTHSNGIITSPNYPEAYPASIECNWKIQVDFGNNIEITFYKIELEKTFNCILDYIELYNGEDDTYPLIAHICHQNQPTTFRTSGNFMFVKFKADVSIQWLGFYANYTTQRTKCGGKYVADKANIMSPNYPKNYNKNDTCGYLIQVTEGYKIELLFEDFDLYSTEVICSSNNNSYVKVYDGPSVTYPLLFKICGKNAPNSTIISTTNTMFVEMVTRTETVAKGFLAKYHKSCGVRIETEGTGIIKMGLLDFDYIKDTNCTWTIVSKDLTKHVSLIITHMDTHRSSCDEGNRPVKVYNGETSDAPLLGEYCGTKIPPVLTSDGSALHLSISESTVFFATYSVYDSACGGSLTSTEGFFASPGYPKKYPMDVECEWTIHISEGNHVSLYFTYFELLKSDNCNTDYLEIRKGNASGKLLGVFCGDESPTNITHVGNLWILLKTSQVEGDTSTFTAKGFYAEYALNHQNELSGPSGTIVSPLYAQDLPFSGDYSWTITVNYGKRIRITFKEINIESEDSLCFSQLSVYDGFNEESENLGEICGNSIPKDIESTSNSIFIKFSGYFSTTFLTKFIFHWLEVNLKIPTTSESTNVTGCGSPDPININSLKNYIKINSPGYPNGYAPYLKCEWIFTTISMNRIKIYLTDVNLFMTQGTVCYGDYIEIFEKKIDSNWNLVAKICKQNMVHKSQAYYATNLMKVVFVSDGWENGTGFSGVVREDCGGVLTDASGFITFNNETKRSYGYTDKIDKITCQWNITVRSGKTIQIEILKLDIHNSANGACDNYLIIRNGKFPDSPLLGTGKYCGKENVFALVTTANNAFIKYTGLVISEFNLRYREISYNCGGEISLSQFANITEISSPNYPNASPPHIECIWKIIGPPGEILRIDFVDRFDLNSNEGCKKEYVEIRDGGTIYSRLINRFCTVPSSQFSTDNIMFVKFFTDIHDPSNGFKAKISLANCGGTIRGNFGQINSPFFNSPDRYPINVNCSWHFIAPLDHNMEIKFNKLDLEESDNCTSVDHIKVHEQNDETDESHLLGYFCGKRIPTPLKTSGNEAFVNFVTDTRKKEFDGFSMQFNASLEACGGTIEANEGTIQSPGYPFAHKSSRRCYWVIVVPRGRRVTLTVEDMEMDTKLRSAFLNGLVFYHKRFKGFIKILTMTNPNKVIESTDNTLFVLYYAPGNGGRGFKARFSSNEPSMCEGDFNQDSGIITQPKPILPSYFCTYIRDKPSSQGTTLALTVTTTTNATAVNGKKLDCSYYRGTIQLTSVDGKKEIGRVCTPSSNVIIRSPFSSNKIEAVQSYFTDRVNFTISYNTYSCGGIKNDETGTIKSPGYPNKYSQSVECSWLLRLPKEQTIQVTFNDMNLGSNCEKSYIDIYNGDSPMSPKIDRFCQSNKPEVFRSQTNSLWIEYKYDRDSTGTGFSLQYEPMIQGCGGIFHDHTRIIQTPSYPKQYPNNAECLWELRSDEGYHVSLIFNSRFQIEKSNDCLNDFVEIFDWKNGEWISLGKKCGRDLPNAINSTSNRMKVLFRSNDKVTGNGFRAEWKWNCGGEFFADKTERFIVSPGFPEHYKPGLSCLYKISATATKTVNIKFYSFSLEGGDSNCRYDNLTIQTSDPNELTYFRPLYRRVYCSTKLPPDVSLMGTVYVEFKTDLYIQKSGFRFSYQLDECGGKINSPTLITTPVLSVTKTSYFYYGRLQCVWNITAPGKKVIVVNFQKFDLEYSQNCYNDNFEIYEGSTVDRLKRIANICGNLNNQLPMIKSKNNSLVMVLKTDRTMSNVRFKAEIYFTDGPEAGCGGRIALNKSTTISAPNLVDVNCIWDIYSPVGTNVKIQFSEISLPYSCGLKHNTWSNCSCSFLEIKDGNILSETIEKFCGIVNSNFGREITSSTNSISIRLFTRGTNNKAFKITLIPIPSICGPVNVNVTNVPQILTSPGYPNSYPSNLRCTWLFKGPNNFVIRFIDVDLNEDTNQHVITNRCHEDNLQIIDTLNSHIISDGLGPSTVLAGNRRLNPEFLYFTLVTGTHQFCGKSSEHFDYYSNIDSLTVKFSSGSMDEKRGKGFKLEYYTVGCNRNFTSLQGRISGDIREDCYQTITVPENYTISIFFQNLVMVRTDECNQVGIEIRDGGNKTAPVLQKSCGYGIPNPIFSSQNKLWIHSWNKLRLILKFDMVYTSTDQGRGCGGVLYNYKGRFSSPFYPSGYKNSTQCVWNVKVPIGMRVALKFSIFDIQGNCDQNYVTVTTYEKELASDHKFCKNDNPATLYSNSHLMVTYQSSLNNGGTGWLALFEAVDQ